MEKKPAVDLTDLALGIVVLGIVVAIGATLLSTYQDSKLTDLTTYLTVNETVDFTTDGSNQLANGYFQSIIQVMNTSDSAIITSGNYSVSVDVFGKATLTNLTDTFPFEWDVTYSAYNTTSRADYTLIGDANTGLAEFGNWFKILVIVGVAAVVLSLVFLAFGGRGQGSGGVNY